jgi:hypothetical protein
VVDLEQSTEGDFTPRIADVEGSFHNCAGFVQTCFCRDPVPNIVCILSLRSPCKDLADLTYTFRVHRSYSYVINAP